MQREALHPRARQPRRRRAGLGRRGRAHRRAGARDAGRPTRRPAVTVLRSLLQRAAVLGTGLAVLAVAALPDPSRPVLVAAALAAGACVVAAVIRRPLAGTVALAATTVTVLLAGALDASDGAAGPGRAGRRPADGAAVRARPPPRRPGRPGGAVTVTRSRVAAAAGAGPGRDDRWRNRRRHGCPGRRTLGSVGPRRSDCRGGRPRGRRERAPHRTPARVRRSLSRGPPAGPLEMSDSPLDRGRASQRSGR